MDEIYNRLSLISKAALILKNNSTNLLRPILFIIIIIIIIIIIFFFGGGGGDWGECKLIAYPLNVECGVHNWAQEQKYPNLHI